MLSIEGFRTEDADEIAELEKLCFSSPWSREELLKSASLPYAVYLVARVDGAIAGYAGMYAVCGEGEINNIAVFPKFRRAGVGSALIGALADAGRKAGVTVLKLEVRASNQAALSLYEKCGFRRVGVRRGYYTAPKEDAVLLDRGL